MARRKGPYAALCAVCLAASCSVDTDGYRFETASGGGASGSGGETATTGGRSTSTGGADGTVGGTTSHGGSAGSAGRSEEGGSAGASSGGSAGADGEAGAAGSIGGGTTDGGSNDAGAGGSSPGGSSPGGSSTGGKATGGSSTGGKATGGSSTGGAPPVVPPSCQSLSATCQGESCCTTLSSGGTFKMGRSLIATDPDYAADMVGTDEVPEHSTTVAPFSLDKYEVTVGRFRKFVANYQQWHVTNGNPKTNAGLHAVVGHTGWGQSWGAAATDLPADAAALTAQVKCSAQDQTWTDTAASPTAARESYPLNCIDWFTAFAFCVWDGGRLPTEAEWEFMANGLGLNYKYPWGIGELDNTRANYAASNDTPLLSVGSKPAGAGYLGHLDLLGSVEEWLFDFYDPEFYGTTDSPAVCINCVNWSLGDMRVTRGGSWSVLAGLRVQARSHVDPKFGTTVRGVRCARD